MNGKIKTLKERGFGFISGDGLERDLFFHSNALVGVTFEELREGDMVSFDTEESVDKEGNKRMNAVNVQRA